MSHKKVLGVGVPEALGLKAEIERAISESKNASMSSSAVKPKDTAAKTNRGVRERAQNDLLTHETQAQQSSSHQAQIAKTKRALEKKARIYDMLTNTTDDRNSSSNSNVLGSAHFDDPYIVKILEESSVDFACKQLERRAEKLGRQADSQTGFELSASNSDNDNASDLVEIIDEFGRSRMVPRNKKRQYHTETSSDSDSDSTDDGNGPWITTN
ncbi:hypothetical protein EV175_003456 [Coemansia sp. RSA 1933]|nr:hypothetical protein EV175_003456 [Coemansia sp. RSA 1933]